MGDKAEQQDQQEGLVFGGTCPVCGEDFVDGFDAMYEFAERVAPLGNADADSCADYAVTLLSDLTRMVTMQTLYHDGGFSTMGISDEIVEAMEDAFAEDEEDE